MIEHIDHVNLVVRDMPAMVAFYQEVLGLRVTKQATIRGPWIEAVTGLRHVEAEVAFLELPSGPSIELLRYRTPAGERPPGLSDPHAQGLRHVALRATDLDGLVRKLKAAGVALFSEIQQVPAAQVDYADQRKHCCIVAIPRGICWNCAASSSPAAGGLPSDAQPAVAGGLEACYLAVTCRE